MLELFRVEAETQTAALTTGLLELESKGFAKTSFEALMRAAHSLKGAARIVNVPAAARVAHALEDCFVAARRNQLRLDQAEIDLLLRGVDLLAQLAHSSEPGLTAWEVDHGPAIESFLSSLGQLMGRATPGDRAIGPLDATDSATGSANQLSAHPELESMPLLPEGPGEQQLAISNDGLGFRRAESAERVLRLTAENLNRLLGLAGESLVESRWLRPFGESFQRLKRRQMDLRQQLEQLQQHWSGEQLPDRARSCFNELFRQLGEAQQFLSERMQELDAFDRRTSHLAQRLYLEVLRTRMRPFSDGVRRFPRMVRDLARSLGKHVKLEILGEATQVDRDILELLETPLAHLLRNGVDHGCEPPEVRVRLGKPAECSLRLEARHSAGVLLVSVTDDGPGVDLGQLRHGIVRKGLLSASAADKLSEPELLQFLFLPGFTLRDEVTEISGRGFGLDIVQNMIKNVRGAIRVQNQLGRGLRVQLQLPLTLSVIRALLVEVAGEPYAIPLNQITRTLKLPRASIETLEGKYHFRLGAEQIGLRTAHEVLACAEPASLEEDLSIVVLSERNTRYGLLVDGFLGERELVVQPLDARLGEVKNISAAASMEDGAPVLIMDVETLVRSIQQLIVGNTRSKITNATPGGNLAKRTKRVLAVDDSLTVRELECKLLLRRGFLADLAIDGLEAWEAVQARDYDLVITDVDMPRLDGIELTRLIRSNARLNKLPVLILSYKDCEADRLRGLESGADAYLTKGSFEDDSLLQTVVDLIGEPVT
jgi:two-component system sensor histidine kinase and response regulator WspE